MGKQYGQFCGLARATEVIGERWTLLILRDLMVGPARFSELRAGLPGIAATMLSARLTELQRSGIVRRVGSNRTERYELTEAGAALQPALRALSLWGAASMDAPREGEIVTDRSLASMLATTRTDTAVPPFVVQVEAAGSSAHAIVTETETTASPGAADNPDLVISGDGLRDLLAHPATADTLIAAHHIHVIGPTQHLRTFCQAFRAPLDRSPVADEDRPTADTTSGS